MCDVVLETHTHTHVSSQDSSLAGLIGLEPLEPPERPNVHRLMRRRCPGGTHYGPDMTEAAAPGGPKHTLPPEQASPGHVKADERSGMFL